MGDRITLFGLKCAYCNVVQKEVYYAESCGFISHDCEKCGKNNRVGLRYELIKNE